MIDKRHVASALNFSQNVFAISQGEKGYFFSVFSGNGIDKQHVASTLTFSHSVLSRERDGKVYYKTTTNRGKR